MSSPSIIKRRCVFCGGGPVSVEDVWPKWIKRLLKDRLTDTSFVVEQGDGKKRETPELDATVKRVCERCNNEWMSLLEEQAKPILTPMIMGEIPVRLTPASQLILATWAVKTALMLDCLNTERQRVYPASVYSSFFQDRHPAPQTAVWVGAYWDPRPRFYASTQPIEMAQPPEYTREGIVIGGRAYKKGVLSTFAANAAVFQIANMLDQTVAIRDVPDPPGAIHIWPQTGVTFDWPLNKLAFDDAVLEAFATRTVSLGF